MQMSSHKSCRLRLSTAVCLLNLTPDVHCPMMLSAYDEGGITLYHLFDRCCGEVVLKVSAFETFDKSRSGELIEEST